MNDDEIGNIKFNSDAAKAHVLIIFLLLLVFIFPFIVVHLMQGYMIDLWGEEERPQTRIAPRHSIGFTREWNRFLSYILLLSDRCFQMLD